MNNLLSALGAHATAQILLFVALLVPSPSTFPHVRLAAAFLPLIWSLHIYTWSFGLGYIAAVHALWSTELLLFQDPRKDFALLHFGTLPPATVGDEKEEIEPGEDDKPEMSNSEEIEIVAAIIKEKKRSTEAKSTANGSHRIAWAEPYPESLWKRFVWVAKLIVSFRYIGWSTSNSQTVLYSSQPPPPSSQSRISFVTRKLLLIGICFGIMDVTNFYQYFDPYMQIETSIDEAFPRRLAGFFAKYHLDFMSPRFVRIAVLALQQYSTFTMMGAIPAVFFVTLGGLGLVDDFWGRVENWPSIMGNPMAIAEKGLRGFWGRFWHQLFRNILVGPGKALARLLDFPEKSTAFYMAQVICAFGISGALHSATLPRDIPNISPFQYASFFWLQGLCVLYEIAVIQEGAALRLNGPRPAWLNAVLAAVRVVWTGLVLYYTVPVIEDELIRVSRIFGLRPVYVLALPE